MRPLIKGWFASSRGSWASLPTPTGKPTAHAAGPNADRLLLIGSGISVGYGAKTQEKALAGHLARALSELTGRGARIDVVVTDEMTGHELRDKLTRKWLSSVDAIVATPGGPQTLLLHSSRAWRDQISKLLEYVRHEGPSSLHVFFVGIPPLPSIFDVPRILGILATHSARKINAQLRLLCEKQPNTTYIDFVPTERASRGGPGRTYGQWAEMIAPYLAAVLDEHTPTPGKGSRSKV